MDIESVPYLKLCVCLVLCGKGFLGGGVGGSGHHVLCAVWMLALRT